jgi:hypothetical protein
MASCHCRLCRMALASPNGDTASRHLVFCWWRVSMVHCRLWHELSNCPSPHASYSWALARGHHPGYPLVHATRYAIPSCARLNRLPQIWQAEGHESFQFSNPVTSNAPTPSPQPSPSSNILAIQPRRNQPRREHPQIQSKRQAPGGGCKHQQQAVVLDHQA